MRRAISMVACLGLAVTTLASTAGDPVSAAGRDPVPWSVESFAYQGKPACHADTGAPKVRIWWTEQDVPGQLPGSDGSCATKPHIAELFLAMTPGFIREENKLGLPKQGSDLWLRDTNPFTGQDVIANGGSKALDIYLGGTSGGGGLTLCVTSGNTRSAAAVMIGTPGDNGAVSDALYRVVLAHELAHVGQCAIQDGHGHTATDPSDWVVEGGADMVAASVEPAGATAPDPEFGDVPVLADGPVGVAAGSPVQVFNGGAHGAPDDAYDSWPFWYALTKGKVDDRYRAFLALAAQTTKGHKKGDLEVLRKKYSTKKLRRALLAAATFDLTGQGLKGLSVPYGYWWNWRNDVSPQQYLDDVGASPQHLTVKLAPGAVALVRVRPANPSGASLSLTVSGNDRTAKGLLDRGVRVTDQLGRVVTPTSLAHWQVLVGPPPTFTVPSTGGTTTTEQGDSEAWVVLANADQKSASFTVTATSS